MRRERIGRPLWGLGLVMLLMAGCTTAPGTFAPASPLPIGQFSQEGWESVVKAHVADGRVDYPRIQQDSRFAAYVATLDRIDPTQLSTPEQLAFWINAYNAFAVQGILDGYSPATLWGRYRYFIGRDYRVGGRSVNLYDLERSILVAQFHEPRMHFAIVCASASCPKLQPWGYAGHGLDEQLDRVTREFINDPAKNRFDPSTKTVFLSMLFKWFEKDFESRAGSVMGFVQGYVNDAALRRDLERHEYQVEFLDYDWSLNGSPPQP